MSGHGPLDEALVVLDRLVAAGAVEPATIRATAATATGRGCRPARSAADRRGPPPTSRTGWRVLLVTAEDLRRPQQVIARTAAALGA